MFFREPAANGFGPEYDSAGELREVFWETIPDWKLCVESESTQVFLEWFRFGLFMKTEWRPEDLPESEAQKFWRGYLAQVFVASPLMRLVLLRTFDDSAVAGKGEKGKGTNV
ncbi:hypothetical protein TOPH_08507 [Tolypocladium ophioglossoides CBS 100239]|uniref:Uncharacterized protein n=1 Tax=Tolypocladium ophioglossoides (strain CBS 100239) TaxID=1163406 RepID=A0A0L0MY52_TOLOC|nr:hypothetical protein TOPH_08507 [Tolypocladium ophioglossoides CBS 100239]